MAKNWAICIGINQYQYMQSLEYAVRDAEQMSIWFRDQGTFEKVYLFTDNSPPIADMTKEFPSYPTHSNLLEWMGKRFKKQKKPPLSPGDNLWFFFSGHGCRYGGQDYLLFSNTSSISENTDKTAISIDYITERLRNCGAGNIILFIDACRDSTKRGSGLQLSNQQGIISISSCSPDELSYEIEELRHGSFTYALLESLDIGNCATVERLCNRLRYRIKEINQYYKKPEQTPYAAIEPESKYHLILLPSQATLQDVKALKWDAYQAEHEDVELAEKLWIQVLVASPADPDALAKLKKFWLESLKSQHKSQIQQFEASSEMKKQEIQQFYQNQIQELEESHELQIKELEESYQKDIRQLEVSYQTKVQELENLQAQLQKAEQTSEESKTEFQQLKQSYQSQIQELEDSYKKNIRELESGYQTKIKALIKNLINGSSIRRETVQDIVEAIENQEKIPEDVWQKIFDREGASRAIRQHI